jgi:flagellar biosynthesis protein FlhB
MLFGMPAGSFLAFAIWPIFWTIFAIIAYIKMKQSDVRDKEAEEGGMTNGN